MHILTTRAASQDDSDKKYTEAYWDLITINAQYETKKEDYTFQHKYRMKSIQSYFNKEMLWAAVIFWLSF
jgi:hypothetical protein